LCPKCRHKVRKAKDPERYFYIALRGNARRRGKPFELTLEEFRRFCKETDYIIRKGRTGKCASIDRIDSSKGYSYDNIQVLSVSENSSKGDSDMPF
jgi:hypothetical protein